MVFGFECFGGVLCLHFSVCVFPEVQIIEIDRAKRAVQHERDSGVWLPPISKENPGGAVDDPGGGVDDSGGGNTGDLGSFACHFHYDFLKDFRVVCLLYPLL